MKAAYYEEFNSPITVRELPVPELPPHGALIKVRSTGICRSDWHGWRGNDPDVQTPHVPGHEFSGIIERTGAGVTKFSAGQRVTVPFVCGCGACQECSTGNTQVCRNQTQPGFTHWGSFATYVVAHNADLNLVEIPDEMPFAHAAILGCRFATSYRALIQQGRINSGQYALVLGCGGIGLSALMIAVAKGAKVIAVDINNSKLDKARSLGASFCFNIGESELAAGAIRDLTDGGVDVAIDALGLQQLLTFGIDCLRAGGRHVQVGIMHSAAPTTIPISRIIARELEVIGSHGLSASTYHEMFDFITKNQIDLGQLISRQVSLEDGVTILQKMEHQPPLGMAVIDMDL